MSPEEAVAFAFDPGRILRLEGNGHPIHFTFIFLLANLGWRLADLHGPYWIGYVIQAINVSLVYLLLKRVHSRHLGLLGGLAYVLYSADTTQAFLTHSLGLHPALTIFLLASLAYVSGCRWLAYLLSPLMLLTYETVYPVFLTVPLLQARVRRDRIRELVLHGAILGAILVGFMIWRLQVGDDRVGGLAAREAVLTPLVHMMQGPVVALGTYVYRALQTISLADAEVAITFAIGAVFLTVLLARMDLGMPRELREALIGGSEAARKGGGIRLALANAYRALPPQYAALFRLIGAGASMLVLAYPLTFTVRAYAISGRDTRVHAAGVIGAAILVGSLALLALWTAEAFGRRRWAAGAFGVWFALLIGYGFVLQRDYRDAWVLQQRFWSSIVRLIPDVSEGDSVLVDPLGLEDTRQIGANYWNLPVVLEQIYQFPEAWRNPVWVYRMAEGWEDSLLTDDGRLGLDARTTFAPPSTFRVVDPGAVIVIETESGRLERRSDPLSLDGHSVVLKTYAGVAVEPAFPPGFLYRYLIATGGGR